MWNILKLKKVWIPLLLLVILVVLVVYVRNKNNNVTYTTADAKKQDLVQTVSATGTVEAAEEVGLNFKTSGRLTRALAKVGDVVKPGQLLATLDNSDVQAAVLSAQANLKSAQASLEKLKAGAQIEDVAVTEASVAAAQTTLDNAKQALVNTRASQTQAVANALAQLLGLQATAVANKSNISTGTITVSGTYNGTEKGIYTIRIDNTSNTGYSVFGLETVLGSEGSKFSSTPLGTRGLKIQFSSTGTFTSGDVWTVEIPNTASSSYSTYQTAYDAALTTQKQQVEAAEATVRAAEQALAQTQAQLAYKKAPPRSYDILAAEAQVESARASLYKAQSDLSNGLIMAPVAGTITKVNNQVGETTSLATPVLILLAKGNYEIKVQVSESDIAKLVVGQVVDITLDAFGSSEHFAGHVSFIDPASTVIQDVVYYNVTVLFDNSDERIKPGMTANIDITTAKKEGVLVVPLRSARYESRQAYVEVLQNNQPVRKNVTLGLKGDDGLVEVTSGLAEWDKVITSKTNGTK